MSYKITQNTDGSWALVNQITGNTVLSADSADALSIASAGLLGMSRGTLAATGSGASTAAVVTKQVTAVTASDGTKAVALPAAATTTGPLLVINTVTTAALPVYPVNGGNDNINAGAEDAAFTLGAGKAAWFIPTSATQWYVEDAAAVTSTTTELNYVDVTTAGTVQASKAAVVDANKDIGDFRNLDVVNLDAGASGTAGTVDIFPTTATKGKFILSCTDQDADTNVTLKPAAMGQASVISIPDPGAATANVVLTDAANDGVVVTATSAELNYNDVTTLGTLEASKTWTSDASLDTVMPTGGLLTVQSGGAVTMDSGSTLTVNGTTATTAASAEHGAGAIGTAAAPATRRWTDRGVIVTQTTFDLTGLASVAVANDVIGLAAGGVAYIGRNVEATNGIIFKVELSCIETPTGGDNDVNVVANSNAALAYDGAGGTTYLSNSGDLLKGQTIQNLLPALTEGDYLYLTAGTGDTAGTYTAGMYVLTTYGHAALA